MCWLFSFERVVQAHCMCLDSGGTTIVQKASNVR